MHIKYNYRAFKAFKPYLGFVSNKIKYIILFTTVICILT